MKPTQIHHTIAEQVANTMPDDLIPGEDVGMQPLDEHTLAIVMPKLGTRFDVRYDAGPDTYTFTRYTHLAGPAGKPFWLGHEPLSDVYCDQLGELIFGSEAKAFSLPIVRISDDGGETWETIA